MGQYSMFCMQSIVAAHKSGEIFALNLELAVHIYDHTVLMQRDSSSCAKKTILLRTGKLMLLIFIFLNYAFLCYCVC